MTRKRLSLPIVLVAILAIVTIIAATSGGAQRNARPRGAGNTAISLAQTPVGKTLADANGRALYLFAADQPNVSRLSAAGQAVWPPFTSSTRPGVTGGASEAQIGVIPTTRQVTYNGHPLYYYVGDQRSGQIAGQGLNQFGARWYVLGASGAAITSTGTSVPSTQSGEGANYAY